MKRQTDGKRFYDGRMPIAASEPNFSGVGPSLLPSAIAMRVAGLGGALSTAALLGFAFGRGAPVLAIALVAAGAALVLAACLFADSERTHQETP